MMPTRLVKLISRAALYAAAGTAFLALAGVLSVRDGALRYHSLLSAEDVILIGTPAPLAPTPARASQGSGCMPTTGTVSGLTLVQDINAGLAALISSNSGSSAPSTDCSGAPVKGQWWIDTSVSPNVLRLYDGTVWMPLGALDLVNHVWTPLIGGSANTNIASAATVDLGAVPQSLINVTGTTTITSFGSASLLGTVKLVRFTGSLTLTYNATSLQIPGAANITTQAGDQALLVSLCCGNWTVFAYSPVSGQAISNPAVPVGSIIAYGGLTAPANYAFTSGACLARASFPALTTALSLAESGNESSGSATITGLPSVDGIGPGAVVEGSGIPVNTTVVSVPSSSSVTLSASATLTQSTTLTFFPYGTCSSTTNIALPDLRGRAPTGRDNMGGSSASRITTAATGVAAYGLGTGGGAQTYAFLQANLPLYNLTVAGTADGTVSGNTGFESNNWQNSGVGVSVTVSKSFSFAFPTSASGAAGFQSPVSDVTVTQNIGNSGNQIQDHSHAFSTTAHLPLTATASTGGSGTAFSLLQPLQIVNYIIRTQ